MNLALRTGTLLCALGVTLGSQSPPSSAPSGSLRVYLVTVGEGAFLWEKFGHNALWFVDSAAGVDVAYTWGTFDFKQPGFVARFLTGDTKYWVEGYPGRLLLDFFITRSDRSVDVQRLNLTPAQARKALDYALWNARDENKYYRYDYFRDNCSTRLRDVIDLATDGALKRATSTTIGARTYRAEAVRLMDDMKLAQLGIAIALGPRADAPLSVWDEMFIPMRLRDALRDVRVAGAGAGETSLPLVADERVEYTTISNVERPDAPSRGLILLLIGLVIGADLLVLGWLGERLPRMEIAFRVEATVWAFATGLLGLVILLAWAATRHVFWAANANLFLLNPLALWLALLAPARRWARPAAVASSIVALLGAVALVLAGLSMGQDNLAIIGLVLPGNFAVAFGLWRRASRAAREM